MRLLAKLTAYLLKHNRLSGESKMIVMNALLDNVSAIPYKDMITFENGTILIGGRALDFEQAQNFVQSTIALQDNYARKILQEQTRFEAVKMSVHNGLNADTILFGKAALWNIEQENALLKLISNN